MAETKKTTPKKTQKAQAEEPKKELIRKKDGTIELNITVSKDLVKKEYEKREDEFIKRVTVPGFRKGMAPKEVAKKNVSQEALKEEVLKELVTNAYKEAVEKHKLQPIITPQIHIEAYEFNHDLRFSAEVAEEPKVELREYKKAIQDLNAKGKIVTEKDKEPQKPSIDAVITAGLSQAKITIPNVIIEREVSRLLSQMIDEIKMLGMTLEQYLESKKITGEDMRKEYRNRAERDIKLEFFLRKVAEVEKITVNEEDIANAIGKIGDKEQQQEIMQNPYLVASIIRQQKTIDFLTQI